MRPKLTFLPFPKYQNSPFKVAPQPFMTVALSPNSNPRSSLVLPKWKLLKIFMICSTVEVNDHWLRRICSTQHQNGIRGWWRGCYWLRWISYNWGCSWFSARITFTWTSTNAIFLRVYVVFLMWRPYIYLTRAIELTLSEIITAISFTVTITIASIHTST